MRKWITCTIMAVMMAAMIFMGTGNNVFANDEVTYDSNMQTKKFDVDVKVGEDGSYTVTENIKVKFVNPRHGIYRYIPYKGKVITSYKNGDQKKLLYYADFTLLSNDSKTDVDEDSDGNNRVLRFGSADYTVSKGNYRFTYQRSLNIREIPTIICTTIFSRHFGEIRFQKEVLLQFIFQRKQILRA